METFVVFDADANTLSVWYSSMVERIPNSDITLFILYYDSLGLESCSGTKVKRTAETWLVRSPTFLVKKLREYEV